MDLANKMGLSKKIPWYTHRLMHRKRVTSELHNSYFRLMAIKHAIPKIGWAIDWVLNYYITLSRQLEMSWRIYRRDVVGKATLGRRGPRDPRLSFRDQLVIRCSNESHHPAESWASGPPVEQPWRTKKTQRWRPLEWGSMYCSYVRSPTPSPTQTLQIKWETLFF